jgi:serine/threonine-protein kinase
MGRALVGQRLGHFELQEFVGGGGMGAVFRATDPMLNRTVAVKVLSGQNTQDDTLARFKKEAQNAARLDHERIARVYYVGEDQGWNYIVFEYIDGVNIRDLVQESGPLPISDAVYFTLQVAEALRHACRRDVVHRDIKPSNILVTNDGRAKLVDMGLARRHEVESQQGDLTASGVTLGTFDYISPEQARDPRNADVRSDIYSLGCTLYYMLTARPPFPDGTVLQKLFSHATDAPPDPRLYRPDIPDDVCRAVQKMLAKSPAQRYQTPDDLIADLLKIGERLGLDSSNGEAAVWVSRPVNRAKWYEQHLPWAAPVVTLIAVILLLDWFSSRGESNALPPPPTLLPPLMNTGADGERPFPTQAQDSPLTSGSDASRGWPEPSRATDSPVELVERERPLLPTNSANGNASTPDAGEVPAVTTPLPPVAPPSAVAGSPATPAGNSTATPGTTSTPPAVPNESAPLRTLLVGPLNTPHGPGAKVVASLGEAVREAANLRELEVIELHFDGEQVELPMDFAVENLTVRAAAGFNPVVVFRPPSVSTLATDRRMVRMFGNRITFERIQFRLELPPEHIGNGWSLFALEQINRLEFEECGLTIRNVGQYGLPAQDEVAFIEFLAPPVLATDSDEEVRSVKVPPLVKLFATIARGEATLIRARTGLPFTISWEQGLLATTERLADIGGALGDQTSDRWVRINLNHVTAAMQDGLCILRSREGAAEHLTPEITAQDCIFLTDSTAPLIEYHTRESLEQLKLKHPTLNGRGNIYSGPSEYWRIITQRGSNFSAPDVSFPLDAGENVGFNEMRLYRKVLWKGLPSSTRPVSSHRKFDYLLSDDPQNPALRGGIDAAGFDALELPEFLPESEPTIPPMRTPDAATPDGEVNPSPAAPAASTMPMMSDKLKMMMTPTTGASGGNGSPASGTKPTDAASPEAP